MLENKRSCHAMLSDLPCQASIHEFADHAMLSILLAVAWWTLKSRAQPRIIGPQVYNPLSSLSSTFHSSLWSYGRFLQSRAVKVSATAESFNRRRFIFLQQISAHSDPCRSYISVKLLDFKETHSGKSPYRNGHPGRQPVCSLTSIHQSCAWWRHQASKTWSSNSKPPCTHIQDIWDLPSLRFEIC